MSDEAEEEVEPTEPDVIAHYQRQARRQRIVGLCFAVLGLAVLVVATTGAATGHFDPFSWYFILGAALLAPGATLLSLVRSFSRR